MQSDQLARDKHTAGIEPSEDLPNRYSEILDRA
jgi:hypothetical protein